MASQGDSKPTKTSDTSLLAPPSEGSGKVRSDNHSAEETHNNARGDQKRFLNHREAEAGGPADCAVCGEEDPGVALEMMVENAAEKNRH